MVNIYTEIVTAVALGTLDSKIALKIASGYESALDMKTLLKNMRIRGGITGMVSGEGPLLIGMAYGEMTVTQIKQALETLMLPEGASESALILQGINRRVCWETLHIIHREVGGSFNLEIFDTGKRTLGGGGGLPFLENQGWQIFVYNLSGADLTGSPSISIIQEAWGVPL